MQIKSLSISYSKIKSIVESKYTSPQKFTFQKNSESAFIKYWHCLVCLDISSNLARNTGEKLQLNKLISLSVNLYWEMS